MIAFSAKVIRRLFEMVTPRTFWVGSVGRGVKISRSARISGGRCIRIEDGANIAGGGWLLVPGFEARAADAEPAIVIGAGTAIGEQCTISAVDHVYIQRNVLFGPRVWVTDHNHRYTDVGKPIKDQGWTAGGSVDIEENCWIGTGTVIVGARGLRIGRGSVIGANSVVTADVPPYTVVGGNPARPLRRYDEASRTWHEVPPE